MRELVVLLAAMAGPAMAQTCPTPPGWAKPTRHVAARSAEMRFALAPNASHRLELRGSRDVRLAAGNIRRPDARRSAGLAALDVPKAGKLDVFLSNATNVDLVRDGRTLRSVSHVDLKTCPGVRKSVTFDVVPGRYIVQLTNAPARSVQMATVLR